jgi:hypothetical protein
MRKKMTMEDFKSQILPEVKKYFDTVMAEANSHFAKLGLIDNGVKLASSLHFKKSDDGKYINLIVGFVRGKGTAILEKKGMMKDGKFTPNAIKKYGATEAEGYKFTSMDYGSLAMTLYFEEFFDKMDALAMKMCKNLLYPSLTLYPSGIIEIELAIGPRIIKQKTA